MTAALRRTFTPPLPPRHLPLVVRISPFAHIETLVFPPHHCLGGFAISMVNDYEHIHFGHTMGGIYILLLVTGQRGRFCFAFCHVLDVAITKG